MKKKIWNVPVSFSHSCNCFDMPICRVSFSCGRKTATWERVDFNFFSQIHAKYDTKQTFNYDFFRIILLEEFRWTDWKSFKVSFIIVVRDGFHQISLRICCICWLFESVTRQNFPFEIFYWLKVHWIFFCFKKLCVLCFVIDN